jgi:hypothetical protein
MMFEHTNMYANRSTEGYGLHSFRSGQSPQPEENNSVQPTGSAQSSQSLTQFAGLQAIADAAMANAPDSMFDPALFEAPRSPVHMNTLTNAGMTLPEEPSVEIPVGRREIVEPVGLYRTHTSQLKASDAETVPAEESLVKDLAASTNSVELNHPSLKDDDRTFAPIIAAESPILEREVPDQHGATPDASEPQILDRVASRPRTPISYTPEVDLPAPRTPEPELVEEHSVNMMEIDLHIQHSPATSDLSEPPASPAIAAAVFKEPAAILEPTVVVDTPAVNQEPAVLEEDVSPEKRQPLSRASSVLSDAPSNVVTDEIEENAHAARKKTKRQSLQRPQATIDGVEPVAQERQTKRQSSRQSKPVERLSTQQNTEVEALSNKKDKKQASTLLVNGHSPSKSRSPEVGRSKRTPSKTPVTTPVKAPGKLVGRKKSGKLEVKQETAMLEQISSPPTETEEEMNRRIALQIHKEGLGLRRRSRGS